MTTHTKHCYGCSITKPTTEFSKSKSMKDGLQPKCKDCNKIDNHKFRTTLNPKHHTKWQRDNAKRVCEIVRKHRAADKSGKVYYIVNPDGEYYIGMTKTHLRIRWGEHKIHYRASKENKRNRLPGLHDSFDKWGIENHRMETIVEFEGISRKDLRQHEKAFIQSFKEKANILNTYN